MFKWVDSLMLNEYLYLFFIRLVFKVLISRKFENNQLSLGQFSKIGYGPKKN
jgi:hypothetical protein